MEAKRFNVIEFLESSLAQAEREKEIVEQSIEKNISTSSAYSKRTADIALELIDMRKYLDYCLDFYGEGRASRDLLDKIDLLHKRREGIIATKAKVDAEINVASDLLEEIEMQIKEMEYYIHNHYQQIKANRANDEGEGEENDTVGDVSE